MTHLTPDELVDLAEGRGPSAAADHAASCETCGPALVELRDALALARSDEDVEPSPIAMHRLSARVGAAVRDDADRRARRTAWLWRWAPISGLAAAALIALAVVAPRPIRPAVPEASPVASAVPGAAVAHEAESALPANDASWILMQDVSQDVTADDAGVALPAGPGSVDRALDHLNDTERAALAEILHEELARVAAQGLTPSDQ